MWLCGGGWCIYGGALGAWLSVDDQRQRAQAYALRKRRQRERALHGPQRERSVIFGLKTPSQLHTSIHKILIWARGIIRAAS